MQAVTVWKEQRISNRKSRVNWNLSQWIRLKNVWDKIRRYLINPLLPLTASAQRTELRILRHIELAHLGELVCKLTWNLSPGLGWDNPGPFVKSPAHHNLSIPWTARLLFNNSVWWVLKSKHIIQCGTFVAASASRACLFSDCNFSVPLLHFVLSFLELLPQRCLIKALSPKGGV